MANGTGQGIGRIGSRQAIERQQMLHHGLHLLLGRPAGTDHRFFHLQGRVFVNLQIQVSQCTQGGATRLAQQQG